MRKMNPKMASINNLKLYLVFWVFLVLVFSTVIYIQIRKQTGLSVQIESITQRLNEASAEQQDLQQKIDSKASDKSIEDFAHNNLGLVYPNEIIIYNDNYKDGK